MTQVEATQGVASQGAGAPRASFAGSGTTGVAAVATGRKAILIDSNAEAVAVMHGRLGTVQTCIV